MTELKINGKAIYTTKGAAREYGRVGCNFYTGCPNECSYCYLKRGAPSKHLGSNVVQLKKCFKNEQDALDVFRKEVSRHIDVLKETGVFFSFTTDPMIPETRDLTLSAVNMCIYNDIPVKILTKEARFVYIDRMMLIYKSDAFRKYLQIGFTLTGRSDMEPKASRNLDRIESMRRIKEFGLHTWASIEPVIDWHHARMMVECSLEYCDHYKIGLLSGVKKDYYNVLESGMYINDMTKMITDAGKTVYLKESARKLLQRCFKPEYYDIVMARTVDMDGNRIASTDLTNKTNINDGKESK